METYLNNSKSPMYEKFIANYTIRIFIKLY
jgi:hypothetical protein